MPKKKRALNPFLTYLLPKIQFPNHVQSNLNKFSNFEKIHKK